MQVSPYIYCHYYYNKTYFVQMKVLEVKSCGSQTIVPVAGDIVTARITVVNQRFAKCLITCIGDVILNRVYRGLLRKEDVRATEKDRVEIYKSYRPGDVVLARVVSSLQYGICFISFRLSAGVSLLLIPFSFNGQSIYFIS